MKRGVLVVAAVLLLAACGSGLSSEAHSGSAHLVIDGPRAGQVLTVHSVGVSVRVDGIDQYRLHYYIDGNDRGEGDTSLTVTNLSPGNHHVEVEALHADGGAFDPKLRAGVDFVIQ